MPVYEYACAGCGPFTEMRPMADFDQPCTCPDCGASAPRVLLTAPRLARADPATIHAHAVNERSRSEPARSGGHVHGPGCGCGSGARLGTYRAADGSKSFPGKRPWMISH